MPAFAAAIVNVFSFFRNFISLLICWFVTMLPMVQISAEKTGNSNCRRGKFYSSLIILHCFDVNTLTVTVKESYEEFSKRCESSL